MIWIMNSLSSNAQIQIQKNPANIILIQGLDIIEQEIREWHIVAWKPVVIVSRYPKKRGTRKDTWF